MKRLALFAVLACSVGLGAGAGCNGGDLAYYLHDNPQPQHYQAAQSVAQLIGDADVDIIWVIDNSQSMDAHQKAVIRGANGFIQEFTKTTQLHWRMGIISSDIDDDPYLGFDQTDLLQWNTLDNVSRFQAGVLALGTDGSGDEYFFDKILHTVRDYPAFFRQNAHLAMISVTDGPEASRTLAQTIYDRLVTMKKDPSLLSLYGIYGADDVLTPQGDECDNEHWDLHGTERGDFADMLKAKIYAICDPDFGMNLVNIGKDLVRRVVRPKFFLRTRPIVESIRVSFKGALLPPGPKDAGGYWFYLPSLNAVVFHDADFTIDPNGQQSIEKVEIQYDEDDGLFHP